MIKKADIENVKSRKNLKSLKFRVGLVLTGLLNCTAYIKRKNG